MINRRSAAPAALFSLATLALLAAIATGCALLSPASPTATVTDANGQQVTLSWVGYPADDDKDPAEVLAAPRAEEVEAVAEQLLTELQAAVDAQAQAPGLAWERGSEGGVYPHDGNGYGGPTMHRTLNSAELQSTAVPDDWPAIVAAIDAVLAERGYGPIEWDFDREPYPHESQAERDADVIATSGSLDPDEMWQWMGNAYDGSMWVSVFLVDVERGVGAPAEAEQWAPQLVSFMVGGTVIAAADEQAYRDGIAPFKGLERPEATHS